MGRLLRHRGFLSGEGSHLRPLCAGALLDQLEERRDGEHVVLDDAQSVHQEVADFGLRAAAAVHHTVDI